MTKFKSGVIAIIAAVLLFCVIYLSYNYNIRWFMTFQNIFAVYGEIMAVVLLYKWVRQPAQEDPKHIDVVANGNTIPDSWVNPLKLVKEKKNDRGQIVATNNGFPDAGNSGDRTGNLQSGSVDHVRPGNGGRDIDAVIEDCSLACEPAST